MSRPSARLVATAAFAVLACHGDEPAGPSLPTITTTDVAAVQQAIALIDSIIADPSLASTRTVAIPFNLVGVTAGGAGPPPAARGSHAPVFDFALRRAGRIADALKRVSAQRDVNLGDFNIPSDFYGGTFVRFGSYFRRDTSLHGAPANGVRVVLYERGANGFSTSVRAGFIEVVDQNRQGPEFITTARVVSLDSATVGAVSANRHFEPSSGLFNVFDVLRGTIGRGPTPPITVVDSLAQFNELTVSRQAEVVTTSVPAAGISMRVVFPADSAVSANSLRFTILVGGKTTRIDGVAVSGTRSYDLRMFIGGQYVGNVSSAFVRTLGDSARTASGERLPEPLRAYMNSIGALIDIAPVAAQVGTSAALLLLILDAAPLP